VGKHSTEKIRLDMLQHVAADHQIMYVWISIASRDKGIVIRDREREPFLKCLLTTAVIQYLLRFHLPSKIDNPVCVLVSRYTVVALSVELLLLLLIFL
jgi:hypothetical protein